MESSYLQSIQETHLWKCKTLPLEDRKDGILHEVCQFYLFYLYFLNTTEVMLSILIKFQK